MQPYRNAVAKSNNVKSIELPVQQEPEVDQNDDNDEFDFELGENENDQPEDEESIDELITSPRRSARLAKIDGETACDDMIPTIPEIFPKKNEANEDNADFDEDDEYDIEGEKNKIQKGRLHWR